LGGGCGAVGDPRGLVGAVGDPRGQFSACDVLYACKFCGFRH
jgi:hypothetical protein